MPHQLINPLFLIAPLMSLLLGCASMANEQTALKVVDYVDVERYLGTWYEIATFPIRPQRGCVGTTATYARRDDGNLSVYNRCYDGSFEGKVKDITGKAWIDDPTTNARLKVQFFWPFRGSYWIIDLDEDYQWAVVSAPGRKNLWILNRDPCMDQALFDTLYQKLETRGFAMDRLEATPQRSEDGQICQVTLGTAL